MGSRHKRMHCEAPLVCERTLGTHSAALPTTAITSTEHPIWIDSSTETHGCIKQCSRIMPYCLIRLVTETTIYPDNKGGLGYKDYKVSFVIFVKSHPILAHIVNSFTAFALRPQRETFGRTLKWELSTLRLVRRFRHVSCCCYGCRSVAVVV